MTESESPRKRKKTEADNETTKKVGFVKVLTAVYMNITLLSG